MQSTEISVIKGYAHLKKKNDLAIVLICLYFLVETQKVSTEYSMHLLM